MFLACRGRSGRLLLTIDDINTYAACGLKNTDDSATFESPGPAITPPLLKTALVQCQGRFCWAAPLRTSDFHRTRATGGEPTTNRAAHPQRDGFYAVSMEALSARAVVLVEGVSDQRALEALAERRGRREPIQPGALMPKSARAISAASWPADAAGLLEMTAIVSFSFVKYTRMELNPGMPPSCMKLG